MWLDFKLILLCLMSKHLWSVQETLPAPKVEISGLVTPDGTLSTVATTQEEEEDEPLPHLLLTPILEEGRIEEARSKSVTHLGNLTSYTGFFTVNKSCDSNLFFWFFPASEEDWKQAPVLLWLNGGPGASSMFGLFKGIGPYSVVNGTLENNPYSWSKDHNVIFLDQPVGTGFSYTLGECYAESMDDVATDVYSTFIQFFTMFPELQENKLLLTGDSYAGHYLPAIAVHIHKQNQHATLKINLLGFMVGNPLIDIRCIKTADFLYELGIIDFNQRDTLKKPLLEFDLAVKSKDYNKSYEHFMELLGLDLIDVPNIYNIVYDDSLDFSYHPYIRSDEIVSQIHVGDVGYNMEGPEADKHLSVDKYFSQAPDIEYLLKTGNYITGFFVGQLDGRCPYSSLPCVLRQLDWPDAPAYLNASRTQWYVADRLAGWVKVAGNLFEVVIRSSGHAVANDQGEFALDLVSAAVKSTPNTPLLTSLKSSK